MKKIIISGLLLFAVAIVFSGCSKEGNTKLPDFVRVPLPLINAAPGTSTEIIPSNIANFSGQVVVDLYFKNDEPPQKFDLVIIKNGNSASVKTIKADITSFPTTVTFTGPQLETLFGQPVKTCDFFEVGVDITPKNGEKLLAFPTTGASYASGIGAQPGASTSVRYTTKVEFNSADYAGDFEVLTDEVEDYKPGEIVQLTALNSTQVSFKYKAADPRPIIVTVNPATLKTSVAKQVFGSGYPPNWPYGDVSIETVTSNDNFVAPCEKTLSIKFEVSVAAGSFGEFKLVLRKKQ